MIQKSLKLLPFVSFIAIFFLLKKEGTRIDWGQIAKSPGILMSIFFFALINGASNFFNWVWLINREKKLLTLSQAYHLFSASVLNRYLPGGKVWQLLTLAKFSEKNIGIETITAFVAITVISYISAILISLGSIFYDETLRKWTWLLVAMGIILIMVVIAPRLSIFKKVAQRIPKFKYVFEAFKLPANYFIGTILISGLLGWLPSAWYSYLLLQLIEPSLNSFSIFIFILACYCSSSVLGYLSLLTPGGMGVTEAILVVLLSPKIGVAPASFIALSGRVFIVIADVVLFTPSLFFQRSQKVLGFQAKP